jgi:hypothetical protein
MEAQNEPQSGDMDVDHDTDMDAETVAGQSTSSRDHAQASSLSRELSRLRTDSRPPSALRLAQPSRSASMSSDMGYRVGTGSASPYDWPFQQDLMTTLECDVCAILLYDPVTTPCQHVSLLSSI